jgi:hypothetical protein
LCFHKCRKKDEAVGQRELGCLAIAALRENRSSALRHDDPLGCQSVMLHQRLFGEFRDRDGAVAMRVEVENAARL